MNIKKVIGIVGLIGVTGLTLLPEKKLYAQPEGGAGDWLKQYNLDIANRYAAKRQKRRKEIASGALLTETPLQLTFMGHPYQVGDHWDVISFQDFNTEIAKGDAIRNGEVRGRAAGFHYQVTSVSPLQIEITQVPLLGLKIVDSDVSSITLTFDEHYKQVSKIYHLADQHSAEFAVGGMRNRLIPLEAFPLELPELQDAIPTTTAAMPQLPRPLEQLARKASYSPDLSHSNWIDEDDFFGRSVQVLWQKNSPWPSFYKTSLGTTILVRGGL